MQQVVIFMKPQLQSWWAAIKDNTYLREAKDFNSKPDLEDYLDSMKRKGYDCIYADDPQAMPDNRPQQ